ncbi:hypothetical protein BH10BAC2_BH10BAC2_19000 [soil metagenome]
MNSAETLYRRFYGDKSFKLWVNFLVFVFYRFSFKFSNLQAQIRIPALVWSSLSYKTNYSKYIKFILFIHCRSPFFYIEFGFQIFSK